MKPDERKQFLGFTLVGEQDEQLMDYATAVRVEDAHGKVLLTTPWVWWAKVWCVLHLRSAHA